MQHKAASLRAFIGAKDYETSRRFYRALGFEEIVLSHNMCLFKVTEQLCFYLQDAYVEDWVDNTMLFLEVDDVYRYYDELKQLGLSEQFPDVRLTPIRVESWGKECFLHDPSGILWHFGQFH